MTKATYGKDISALDQYNLSKNVYFLMGRCWKLLFYHFLFPCKYI